MEEMPHHFGTSSVFWRRSLSLGNDVGGRKCLRSDASLLQIDLADSPRGFCKIFFRNGVPWTRLNPRSRSYTWKLQLLKLKIQDQKLNSDANTGLNTHLVISSKFFGTFCIRNNRTDIRIVNILLIFYIAQK